MDYKKTMSTAGRQGRGNKPNKKTTQMINSFVQKICVFYIVGYPVRDNEGQAYGKSQLSKDAEVTL